MKKKLDNYGKEVIIDLHECDSSTFTRRSIKKYFKELCKLIDMVRCEMYWWDDEGVPKSECQTLPHLVGVSAVQFIMTSNITIHTLPLLRNVYLNIFSCKDFDTDMAVEFSKNWFKGKVVTDEVVVRK